MPAHLCTLADSKTSFYDRGPHGGDTCGLSPHAKIKDLGSPPAREHYFHTAEQLRFGDDRLHACESAEKLK